MKILEYYNINYLRPSGGPAGYLYNLKKMCDEKKDSEFFFLDNNIFKTKFPYIIERSFHHFFQEDRKEKTGIIRSIKNTIWESQHVGRFFPEKYDLIHFHTTAQLYSQKKALQNYHGIIVLTSHSPKVTFKENIEDFANHEAYISNKELFDNAESFDEFAFQRADYIIFPCPGAEEPYYHSWPKYVKIRDTNKIRYVPTGVLPVNCKLSRNEVRQKYKIPQNAILLSYVGRHNEVKGYDILKTIFEKMENVYVICCGRIEAINPPINNRWIEVGWTSDPYSIVGASDVYLLPNRETYFDIAMLQTLSIGKCSVISNTGGNKEFINTAGVKLFNNIDEAINEIHAFTSLSVDERNALEEKQRSEFKERYTAEIFYNNYKATLHKIYNEHGKNLK